ncbi:MAG TPA: IPT/TIG domain-containing protein, partial [Acidimicrobiia bacterium]|nr:IPT/TIG domain-containing protein [Acidimicrobiia bacterium]
MRIQKTPKTFLSLLATALVVLVGACSSDSPTEPSRPPASPPGGGGEATAFSVTVTADPGTLAAGDDDPVVITVRAVRSDNGQPAPDGTLAVVSSLVGAFGQLGGPQSVTIELFNGVGQVVYFPPVAEAGSVVVRATVAGSTGQTTIRIEGTETFFVSHVAPASGSPKGGDSVVIHGSGFDGPVRVLFGGTNATVQSVSPNRIVVRTPPSPGGITETTTVSVSVTINVNEADQATDTLIGAFTYRPGGSDIQQPAIFSITPTTGPNEGGTPVSIIGEGFQAPVQVEFCGGTPTVCLEAQLTSVQSGRIEVISPAATGFGAGLRDSLVTIRVTNLNSGLRAVSEPDAFRYGVTMRVTGLSPDIVDAESPGLVTIFGSGFESPLQVLVDGVQQQVVSVTGTQIVFRPSAIAVSGCGVVT